MGRTVDVAGSAGARIRYLRRQGGDVRRGERPESGQQKQYQGGARDIENANNGIDDIDIEFDSTAPVDSK